MRTARAALAAAAGVATLAAGAAALVAWVVATQPGTAWLVGQLGERLPADVSVGGIGGTLWHGLELREIGVETATARIDIDAAQLQLDVPALLSASVTLEELAIGRVEFRRVGSADGGAGAGLSLPIGISVRDGSIEQWVMPGSGEDRSIGPVAFRVEAAGSRVVVETFSGSGMGFDVEGGGELRLGADIGIAADFQWRTTAGEDTYAGAGSVAGDWPELEFHQRLSAPVAIVADGRIAIGASPAVTLEASWRDLSWPDVAAASSPEGAVRLSGWLDDYRFDGEGTVIADGIEAAVTASGTGGRAAIEFSALEASGSFGAVTSSGRVELDPVAWRLDVRGERLDPSVRFPQWSGALGVTGRFSGRLEPALALELDGLDAAGELRDQPVTAAGAVAYAAPGRWRFGALTVEAAGNEVAVDGTAGEALALDIAVDAPWIERFLPEGAGLLRGQVHVAGTLEDPQLSGRMDGLGLRYRDYAAESVTVAGEIVADDARTVALSLAAETVAWRDYRASSITAGITGTANDHTVDLDIAAEAGRSRLRAQGAWAAGRWRGQLADLLVEQPSLGQWRLTEPAALAVGRGDVDLERACLARGEARLCGRARIGTDDDLLDLEVTAFDLAVLAAALPEDYSLAGRYDGRLTLRGPLTSPAGELESRGIGTRITISEADAAAPLEIPIDTLELGAELSAAGELRVRAAVQGGAGGDLDLEATVGGVWTEQPSIDAEVSGRWTELGMLSLASPDIGEVSGIASVNLLLDGNLRAPNVRGDAHWTGGALAAPRWGLLVEDINADISSENGAELVLHASAVAGEGRLEVDGVTQVDPDAGWPTRLRVFGNGLQAVRLPDADILISPALEVQAALPDVEVNGAFLIPHARLRLDELPPQAVAPSPDTVVHGDGRAAPARPLNVHGSIRVGLGEDVRYSGAGLDVALSGAMGVEYSSGRDAIASGAVGMSGQYQAYGQTLQIDEGRLVFNGPLTNPTLDVRAVRRVESTTVGVELSGTVEAPVSRIFSEPAMSEADALSYLLLGRPLSASGSEEAATLQSAAFSMGLQQALPVIERVGETLGLDEFSVQTTAADTGELMAGKRLSPRVYIRYTYGLFNRIGGFLMRFNLSDRFSLETRSGENSSMDLLYTVEKD